jgi:alcohol dehydrogenase class IV
MWYFRSPLIAFGEDALSHLDTHDCKRAFIVTDHVMNSLGFVERLRRQLSAIGCESECFEDVEPDPSLDTVRRCGQAMLAYQPDWVIGLGGGSCLDAAKAAWLLYERPDVDLLSVAPFEQYGLRAKARFMTIPTTAGSGAEVTAGAVITDPADSRKMEVASYELVPDLTIVDPSFSAGMSPQLTADTGIDVLTHSVEGYTSTFANDFSDGMCVHATRMVFDYLPRAYSAGTYDREARTKMANAATIAALGMGNSHIAMAHSMGHSLGMVFHLPHGRVTGLSLPYTIEFTANGGAGRYIALAQILGLPADNEIQAATNLADATRDLLRRIDLPVNLQEAGISRIAFLTNLEKLCDLMEMDSALATSRRFPYRDEMKKLFEYAFEGREVDF